jgi:hypothetical protein
MGKIQIEQVSGYVHRHEGPMHTEGLRFTAENRSGQAFEHERAGTGVISRAIGSLIVGAQVVGSDALNAVIFRDPRNR